MYHSVQHLKWSTALVKSILKERKPRGLNQTHFKWNTKRNSFKFLLIKTF